MKFRLTALAVALAVLCPAVASAHPATIVIDLVWKHLGGKEQYKKVRYVEFTWASKSDGKAGNERKHLWDRYTGDYVLELTDSESGDELEIYFNIETKQGVVVRNGSIVEGEDAEKMIERAYGTFINDTYWLLVPTKLEDYGARVQFIGHEGLPEELEWHRMSDDERRAWAREQKHVVSGDDHNHEVDEHKDAAIVLHLWFEGEVGLTPGDEYWLYITHEGEILRWEYKLQGGHEGSWVWSDPTDCGMGMTFSTRRVHVDGNREIYFPTVKFTDEMDRSAFEYGG
jgi:hypothetical protein